MSWRSILALALLLAAVGAYLLWFDDPVEQAQATIERLPWIELERLARLELDSDRGRLRLQRSDAQPPHAEWTLDEPAGAAADPRPVEQLLALLERSTVRRVVAEQAADLAAYGLAAPSHRLRLSAVDGEQTLLELGAASPVGAERYAAIGDGRVLLVDGTLAQGLELGVEQFRERRFLPVEPTEIRTITLRPAEPAPILLERRAGGWELSAPLKDRADFPRVDSLALALSELATPRFLDDGCLGEDAAVQVETVGGLSWGLYVCGPAGEGQHYARGDNGVHGVIDDEVLSGLTAPVDEFRAAELVSVSRFDVTGLELRLDARQATLSSGEDAWAVASGDAAADVDRDEIETLLEQLRDLRVIEFLDGAGASFSPTLELTLLGEDGELGRLRAQPLDDPRSFAVETTWRPGVRALARSDALADLGSQLDGWLPGDAG